MEMFKLKAFVQVKMEMPMKIKQGNWNVEFKILNGS